ncbi:MAG: hypothetical protein ACI8UP_004732, partial [Porticoccaceae bacterium]
AMSCESTFKRWWIAASSEGIAWAVTGAAGPYNIAGDI